MLNISEFLVVRLILLRTLTLSSAEAPAGYPHQNINYRKNRKRGGRWEEGNGGSVCHIMYPRWRLISEEDWIQEVFLINIYNMTEHKVRQEEEAVSLSERPLQRAKQGGKTTCWKCFQDASVTNFFAKGAGMIQHFRTMHRNIDVDDVRCKTLFQQLHGKETADTIARLSRFRLETVSSSLFCLPQHDT